MYAQVEKPKENKSRAVANSVSQRKGPVKQGFGFVDNRPQNKLFQKKSNDLSSGIIVQKVKFGEGDTNNPMDNAYLFEAYRHHDIVTLYDHQKKVGAELADGTCTNVENSRKHLIRITEAIQEIQLHAISSASAAQGTIVVSGNVQLDDEILGWSPIAKAGKTPDPNQFKLTPSCVGEYRISQNDAEGKTLTFLHKLINAKRAKISFGKHLQINIQGTYGPCDGCKARVAEFVRRITNSIQEVHVLAEPLVLWVNVLYNNPPLSKIRGGNLKTTYGWDGDQIKQYDAIEPIERYAHTEISIIKPL
jgi:hypothetical protein